MPTAFTGLTNYGIPLFGQGSPYDMPAGRVWFVCNRTGATNISAPVGTARDAPFASLADAAASIATTLPTTCDVVWVLPGHAENITGSNLFSGSATLSATAAVFPAGTRIIGEGVGNQRPVFTFTAAASTLAFAAAGVTIENCQLLCPQTGTTTVAAMVTITAPFCGVVGNYMQLSSSATALATTGISLSSLADDNVISDNIGWGLTGTPTSWLSTTGTAAPDRCRVQRNFVRLPLSSASGGVIDLTANSVTSGIDWLISNNDLANSTAASTVVVKLSATVTGHARDNTFETVNGAAATAITSGTMSMFNNRVAQAGKQSIAITLGGNST